ncbi:DUF1844 domain-containing protein [Telmatobacter bradus]|uniref:DUF1844 domain-containing protein n=1 Tax=Telmatobacter bradus TaxID=474953 RepID=UPI003B42CC83
MSEPPKFEVIDRRKMKAAEEQEQHQEPKAAVSEPEPGAGPRLVVNEGRRVDEPTEEATEQPEDPTLPPAPSEAESRQQKMAYDAAAQRLEDLIRAQNPAAEQQPPVGFENLVQQFYLSAMLQMGAGTQEGQRPRIDIVGARGTIDLLDLLAEKTKGNLSANEDRMLQTVLFDVRMAFLELTSMINMQAPPPPSDLK